MDIEYIIKNADPNVIIFLMTTLVAFISWLIKGLIEKPITESKNTFNRYIEKRIEILTEVKVRLNLIAYFPNGEDSLSFKNQLQEIILKDGKSVYLGKETFDSVLKISIDPHTNEKLLLNTIKNIDNDLYLQITKVQDEIRFYRRFSNYNPLKRFIGFTLLTMQYIFSLLLIVAIILLLILTLIDANNYLRVGIFIIAVFGIYFINKWLKR
ncbi:MAG: hypothetical protein M0P71_17785 [Melioribacteraceae bacterium]|nr:hypothetical protein [Melioribacteraceae bacterium]